MNWRLRMAKVITTPRALALAEMTNNNELLIQKNMRLMVDKAIESGLYLLELKEELPHGSFMDFCEEHVRVKRSQRENYMIAASADPQAVLEYKSSDESSGGLQGLVDKVRNRKKKSKSKIPATGNLEPAAEPEKVEKWTDEDLAEEFKSNPVERVVYGVDDLPKLTANVLHAGILLDNIIEHVDLTPEQFALHLSREITHDGDRPRSASVVAEYTARVEMFMDLIVQTRGLLETKPTLQVI
jgi:hypothetical protein